MNPAELWTLQASVKPHHYMYTYTGQLCNPSFSLHLPLWLAEGEREARMERETDPSIHMTWGSEETCSQALWQLKSQPLSPPPVCQTNHRAESGRERKQGIKRPMVWCSDKLPVNESTQPDINIIRVQNFIKILKLLFFLKYNIRYLVDEVQAWVQVSRLQFGAESIQ